MPIGGFLDAFPTLMFIGAHVAFIAVAVWAIMQARAGQPTLVAPLWLYLVASPSSWCSSRASSR